MTQSSAATTLQVDFSLDLICPWCWIGLRNLLAAPRAVEVRRAQVRSAAHAAGLQINHALIETFPSTRLVCALVNYAQTLLDGESMIRFVESIFAAYFVQGRDIGSVMVLQQLAHSAALDWNPSRFDALRYQSEAGHAGGVPHMVFNQRLQVTGAVAPAELLRAMEHARVAGSIFA